MDYAQQLIAQLNQLEATQLESTAEVSLPVPELGDDFIFQFKARRVDLSQMVLSGMIPESIAKPLLEAANNGGGKIDPERMWAKLSAGEQLRVLAFQREMAVAVCAEPRLVESREPGAGEVSVYRLPTPIITELFRYAMGLSPDVPVAMADGKEASVEQIESFHAGE